jgi:hypothetical protein
MTAGLGVTEKRQLLPEPGLKPLTVTLTDPFTVPELYPILRTVQQEQN